MLPYASAGAGLYWLTPQGDYDIAFDSNFAPRVEVLLGADYRFRPAMAAFAELRLTGSRYAPLEQRPTCPTDDLSYFCVRAADTVENQLGQAVVAGFRLKTF